MGWFRRIIRSNFFIKLRNWEYWPFGIIQAPIFLYWLLMSLRQRSLFFFSASNPGILTGGMFGESKFDVQQRIPGDVTPFSMLVRVPVNESKLLQLIRESGLSYPLIFKPDYGERGWMVRRINSDEEARQYLSQIRIDFIVQELVNLPLEFGVFYVRYPSDVNGRVVSIVAKEMLSVVGTGHKTLQELILEKDRAKLQWDSLRITYNDRLKEVLPLNQRLELVSIGNHCLGTKFINANHLISDNLSASFDRISKQIDGFFFGRFDLRASSIEDLENGVVKIVELNGCGAEPAHIYDSKFPLWKAIGVLFRHWSDIYNISIQNHQRGVPYLSFVEGRAIYKRFRSR